ncbi:MAG: sulfatase [Spirochaetales bacterium]|nr:sulfatase [Spirochaetales bacterium]
MNVFMILEDALRPDHLGCYGYEKNTSPNIDRIAREGVMFRNCIAVASHTLPPIVSILTGLSTASHRLVDARAYAGWAQSPQWRDRRTPLKVLAQKGYRIDGELVMRWAPLGFTCDTPADRIQSYLEERRGDRWFFLAQPYPTHLPYNPPDEYFEAFLDPGYRMDEDTRERIEVVRRHLIVHPTGVTSKLEAGEAEALPDDASDSAHKRTVGVADFDADRDRPAVDALYDGEVRVFDDLVGGWIARLEELKLLDDTLVIIVADHGEELLERGHVGHCSCNLMGTLYDESIRVPLILRCPRILPKGKVVENQVSQIDIMPTIFDLLGIEQPGLMEGASVRPLIEGQSDCFREEAFSETPPAGWQALRSDDREIWSVRTSSWKLILNTRRSGGAHRYELYDLVSDPGELDNLYRENHPAAVRLEPLLEAFIRRARRSTV